MIYDKRKTRMFPLLDFICDRMHDDFHNFVTVKAGMQIAGEFLQSVRTCPHIRLHHKNPDGNRRKPHKTDHY